MSKDESTRLLRTRLLLNSTQAVARLSLSCISISSTTHLFPFLHILLTPDETLVPGFPDLASSENEIKSRVRSIPVT